MPWTPLYDATWRSCRTTAGKAFITAVPRARMVVSVTLALTCVARSYRSLSIGACQNDFVAPNAVLYAFLFAARPAESAAPHWSTAVTSGFIRLSTASADQVLSLTVDALELMASWSALIVGFALSWLRKTSYSRPS